MLYIYIYSINHPYIIRKFLYAPHPVEIVPTGPRPHAASWLQILKQAFPWQGSPGLGVQFLAQAIGFWGLVLGVWSFGTRVQRAKTS